MQNTRTMDYDLKKLLGKYFLYWIGTIAIVGMIPAFFLFPHDLNSDTSYVEMLGEDLFFWITVISLVVCLPAALEMLLDLISTLFVKADVFTTLVSRVWIILAIFFTASIHLLQCVRGGNFAAYQVALQIRGVMINVAYMHLMHIHCGSIYSAKIVTSIVLAYCASTIVRVYSLGGWLYSAAYMIGTLGFLLCVLIFVMVIVYHFVQEFRGVTNHKNAIGYEMMFIISTIWVVSTSVILSSDELEGKVSLSNLNNLCVSAFQCILLYTAVTHEFKWEFSAALSSLSMKAVFVRFVSHEVRTPLNSCILGLEYLEKICSEEASLSASFVASVTKEIRDSCDDAVEIVNNLLLYEKVDGNVLTLSCAKENIYHITQKVFRSFQLGAQQLGVQTILQVHPSIDEGKQLVISGSDAIGVNDGEIDVFNASESFGEVLLSNSEQALVLVDRPKIHVVLRNMLSNAIKFSPADAAVIVSITPVKNVVISSASRSDPRNDIACDLGDAAYVRISVQDHGPGISVHNQSMMFGNIIQFDPNKLQGGGGSGMGLYLCSKIVNLHQGCKLVVFSEGEGLGTTLSLYIPLLLSRARCGTSRLGITIASHKELDAGSANCCCLRTSRYRGVVKSVLPTFSDDPQHQPTAEENPSNTNTFLETVCDLPPVRPSLIRNKPIKDLSILVVDDSAVNRRMLIRLLKRSNIGGTIEEAVNGVEYLRTMGVVDMKSDAQGSPGVDSNYGSGGILKSMSRPKSGKKRPVSESVGKPIYGLKGDSELASFDVCIVDYNMPMMDGTEAVARLRDLGYMGLILGLTGSGRDEDILNFKKNGADYVIMKPMKIQELVNIINSYTLAEKR